MKKDKIKIGELQIDLIPGEKGSAKEAYVNFRGVDEHYYGSLDNSSMAKLKKLHKWLSEIIEANK